MSKSTKAKQRKMTVREKAERAEIRASLRAKGILPPKKKPLNRKKFIQEARDAFNGADMGFGREMYLLEAISCMLTEYQPTQENVGVAKAVKIACELHRFETELKEQGRTEYTLGEKYERIKAILDA